MCELAISSPACRWDRVWSAAQPAHITTRRIGCTSRGALTSHPHDPSPTWMTSWCSHSPTPSPHLGRDEGGRGGGWCSRHVGERGSPFLQHGHVVRVGTHELCGCTEYCYLLQPCSLLACCVCANMLTQPSPPQELAKSITWSGIVSGREWMSWFLIRTCAHAHLHQSTA